MSTRSATKETILPNEATITRRLLVSKWSDDVKHKLIPAVARLGGSTQTAEGLADAIQSCVADTGVKVSTMELNLMLGLLCEATGQDFLRDAMNVIRELREVAKHPLTPDPEGL